MPILYRPRTLRDVDSGLNRQHYEATSIPPSIHEGTPYPGCTQEELRSLDHAHEPEWHGVWKKKFRYMDIRQAVADFEDRLRRPPSESQLAAIKRLRLEWNKESWTPDLAIKCFADLDRAYFFGQLSRRVRLRWKGSSKELKRMLGPTYNFTMGVTMQEESRTIVPCARIILNAELLFLGPVYKQSRKRETLATLLHEMVHGKFRGLHHSRCEVFRSHI